MKRIDDYVHCLVFKIALAISLKMATFETEKKPYDSDRPYCLIKPKCNPPHEN